MEETKDSGFFGLGIAPALLAILERLHFKTPTPIQSKAIPIAIEGKDVVGIAQTGTGKTLAFGIPLIQQLAKDTKRQGLVLLPTRELALQVDEALNKIGRSFGLRTAILIGGAAIRPQIQALQRRPQIIVATPGRLIDHLHQRTLHLGSVAIVVLDEADRMLDMGFLPQIREIFKGLPKERQTMLFSATMPAEVMKIASVEMKLPVRVEVVPPGTTAALVTQELFIVPREQKIELLKKLLPTYKASVLVFTKTKYGAKKIALQLRDAGLSAAEIHSNRSLFQRREALDGFKSGKYRVLVATDIASRGIDVVGIEVVVNFDFPGTSDTYVHRIGRTARAGQAGHAITFATPAEHREVRMLERTMRKSIPLSKLPDLPQAAFEPYAPSRSNDAWRPRGPRHSGHTAGRGSFSNSSRGNAPRRSFGPRRRVV
jgi:ATP-dependent RNA helicase RhlE